MNNMTDYSNGSIDFTKDSGIGTIEFFHPKGNSLPETLLRKLARTITEAGKDNDVRVVVIRSKKNGPFCAGASFDELLAISDIEQGKEFFMGFAHILNAMRSCPNLIVLRVQGKTVGGGVGIAAAADFTIAHNSASVKLSELALGFGPFVVGPAVIRKIGMSSFSTLSLDAHNWYDAEWAESKGLYNKRCDTFNELDASVNKLAGELAQSNPRSMTELKQIMWQSTGHWDSTLEQRAAISGRLVQSEYTRNYIEEFRKM
ncbi:MAG: enoyl-CoA hydratase/isomerase family protein [Balneolaceae bacterium]